MRNFIYVFPFLGALAGGLIIMSTMAGATSAPQEAAGYAMACALCVVPYVFARAIDMMINRDSEHLRRHTAALEKMAAETKATT
jgi:hypothetical protein